jgi:hypothetical protein
VARRGAAPRRPVCGDKRVPQRVRPTGLLIPARRATRRTIRPAPCRSSRWPPGASNTASWRCWCHKHHLRLFAARRSDIECFARDLEARGLARANRHAAAVHGGRVLPVRGRGEPARADQPGPDPERRAAPGWPSTSCSPMWSCRRCWATRSRTRYGPSCRESRHRGGAAGPGPCRHPSLVRCWPPAEGPRCPARRHAGLARHHGRARPRRRPHSRRPGRPTALRRGPVQRGHCSWPPRRSPPGTPATSSCPGTVP